MCQNFSIVLFVGFLAYNIYISYMCIQEFIYIDEQIYEADPESSESIFVLQGLTELFNSLCGLIFVCSKVKKKIVLFAWILVTMSTVAITFSWEIWFVSREKYQFDAYTFNTCVFIKAISLSSVYVVISYIREFILGLNKITTA